MTHDDVNLLAAVPFHSKPGDGLTVKVVGLRSQGPEFESLLCRDVTPGGLTQLVSFPRSVK